MSEVNANGTTLGMQRIIDRFGWANNWQNVAEAAMALARHVDARLIALEDAKPTTDADALRMIAEIHRLEMEVHRSRSDLEEAEAEIERLGTEVLYRTGEVESVQRDCETYKAQRKALAAEVGELMDRRNFLENEVGILAAQLDALRKENARLSDKLYG